VTFQRQKDEAGTIIQKRLNDYKVLRDVDPDGFYNSVTSTVIDPCEPNTPYKCTVVADKTADGVLITITVEWVDGGATFSTSLSQSLARTIK
jgi:peptidoglycan hydrolase-like protein with peptidoglycan-binding domain